MAPVILVTGGVRSGKSRYAEGRLKDSARVVYIATARLVSPYRMGRVFADILGRVNQRLAAEADEAILLACGIPMRLK